MTDRKDLVPTAREFLVDGSGRGRRPSSGKRGRSTDVVRHEAEPPLCLFVGNVERGSILQVGKAM